MNLVAPLLLLSGALASPDSDIVLILDNSCSMAVPTHLIGTDTRLPANDPSRAAVLGALVVEGLARGSADQVTVIGFGNDVSATPRVVTTADQIRGLPYSSGTWFRGAAQEADRRLDASVRANKLLMFFTDGAPSPGDVEEPNELPDILGLHADSTIDTFAIGLYGSAQQRDVGAWYLNPLARSPDDLVFLDASDSDIVRRILHAFTRGYARTLGSRPLTGTLSAGGSTTIEVGRYVTEVMVVTASVDPGPAYSAKLVGPDGEATVRADGHNGCAAGVQLGNAPESLCGEPRRHYVVFRQPNDPDNESTWTLSLSSANGDVEYGIILRYDLVATFSVPPTSRVGDSVPLEASLLFRGAVFDDDAFFGADNFAVSARIGDQQIPLSHDGGGRFIGSWSPERPSLDDPFPAEVEFSNDWMKKRDRKRATVEGFLDLVLKVTPNPLDLGTWQGARRITSRCAEIDLSGSTNADRVPVVCRPEGMERDVELTCEPLAGSRAMFGARQGQSTRWMVCAKAAACCSATPEDGASVAVRLRGKHDHYANGAVVVPVHFRVEATGFLACWWVEIATSLGILSGVWFVVGWVRPHSFDLAATVKLAGTEAGLRRSSGLVLAELPGGRRGFYRNAKLCLDGEGNPIRKPRQSVLVVMAGPAGTTVFAKSASLERKNRRNNKWAPVPESELPHGYQTGVVYRVGGDLYLKFS